MSLDTQQIEKQLLCDKAIKEINVYLDQREQIIALRGRDKTLMRADYQNLLTYIKILETVFVSTPIDPKQHSVYLRSFPGADNDYFKSVSSCALGLYELMATTPSSAYEDVINGVKKTIHSRINYFSGLLRALPIGRYSYPYDVAWFHRTNEGLIKHYLAEHDNEVLSQPEEAVVKKLCDFKAEKLDVVAKAQALLPQSASSAFFKPGDGTCYEVGNYLGYHLLEPLRALADNYNLVEPRDYKKQLDELAKLFQRRLAALKANNQEDSIALSAAAVNLLKAVNEKQIIPFFSKHISEEENTVTEGMASFGV